VSWGWSLIIDRSGNDACIVLPDVDITQAAAGVAAGSFYNTGQVELIALHACPR
jgi:acyl-CoA reductase-like NAD-dependent aldehyde dehydrogenase